MRHVVIALLTGILLATSGCSLALAQEQTAESPASRGTSSSTPGSTGTPSGSTRRDKLRDRIEDRRDHLATKAAERRGELKERLAEHKERLALETAVLRTRLAAFKDQKKAVIVERINDALAKINTNRTETIRKHLKRMSELLDKLQDRVDEKVAGGKDATLANSAIASASGAIEVASFAVDEQAAKGYTIVVSSESGVRADAKAARDKLHADLQAVRQLVVAAKQAVGNAIRIAATTLGGLPAGRQGIGNGR